MRPLFKYTQTFGTDGNPQTSFLHTPSFLLSPPLNRQPSIMVNYGGGKEQLKLKRLQSGEAQKTLCLVSSRNQIRAFLGKIIYSPIFENAILVCILVTTVTLILEQPDDFFVGDACPEPPLFLNCSGLPPGQMTELNCARESTDPGFDKVWESCDSANSDMVPPCCEVQFRIKLFRQLDIAFTLVFTAEMVQSSNLQPQPPTRAAAQHRP